MRSDMNPEYKRKILHSMLKDGEQLIASVGGHLIPKTDMDPIARSFSVITAQEWGNADQEDASGDDGLVRNVYIGITDQNMHIAFLETYCSEIAEQKMTIPLDEIRWKNFNKGLRNQILISFNGNDYEFIIPNHREITQLKDQHEEAEKIMKIAETATIDQNPLWINLLNR